MLVHRLSPHIVELSNKIYITAEHPYVSDRMSLRKGNALGTLLIILSLGLH